jgi:methylated-DNA-[protein]-cysteine S-methyltransferase
MTRNEEITMQTSYTAIPSPLGELLATRDDEGITGLYLPTGKNAVTPHADWIRDDAAFDDLRTQLDEYFAGDRREFELPLNPRGSAFQQRVWTALLAIPYGETASYGETAAAIGAPITASRAVGLANGQNPISIVVPCHRVIGANGSLVGYGGGLDAKRWLLTHEAAHAGLFAS